MPERAMPITGPEATRHVYLPHQRNRTVRQLRISRPYRLARVIPILIRYRSAARRPLRRFPLKHGLSLRRQPVQRESRDSRVPDWLCERGYPFYLI
jgi:hypothetical protein